MAKLLILIGIITLLTGLLMLLPGKHLLPWRLPGDIHIVRRNFNLYIPLATSAMISLVLSILVYLIRHWRN